MFPSSAPHSSPLPTDPGDLPSGVETTRSANPGDLGAALHAPEQTSLEDLETEICELAAHIAAAMCRWLLLIAEWDVRGGWAEWGVNSCAHWLSWRCSIGLSTAREHVRVARRLVELPLVRAGFETGELSYSKVRAVTRVAEPVTEAQLVELAHHSTGAQLERLVRGYHRSLAATLDTASAQFDSRYVRWSWDNDGSLMLNARLPATEGALLVKAIEATERAMTDATHAADNDAAVAIGSSAELDESADPATFLAPRSDQEESVINAAHPSGARRADALTAMARTALVDLAGTTAGSGESCEIVVHIDADSLRGETIIDQAQIEDGPSICPETARRLACDASLVPLIERAGQPLTVGRRTRRIPPALRRALRSRDGACRFPGCENRCHIHGHHIKHWIRGGETKLDNLVNLCSRHHRLVHEGGYTVERTGAGQFEFKRPDGEVIPQVCHGQRTRGADLSDRQRAAGVVVDSYTCMGKSAGDPFDYGIAVEGLVRSVLRERGHPEGGPYY